jgi:hypothetical protein
LGLPLFPRERSATVPIKSKCNTCFSPSSSPVCCCWPLRPVCLRCTSIFDLRPQPVSRCTGHRTRRRGPGALDGEALAGDTVSAANPCHFLNGSYKTRQKSCGQPATALPRTPPQPSRAGARNSLLRFVEGFGAHRGRTFSGIEDERAFKTRDDACGGMAVQTLFVVSATSYVGRDS